MSNLSTAQRTSNWSLALATSYWRTLRNLLVLWTLPAACKHPSSSRPRRIPTVFRPLNCVLGPFDVHEGIGTRYRQLDTGENKAHVVVISDTERRITGYTARVASKACRSTIARQRTCSLQTGQSGRSLITGTTQIFFCSVRLAPLLQILRVGATLYCGSTSFITVQYFFGVIPPPVLFLGQGLSINVATSMVHLVVFDLEIGQHRAWLKVAKRRLSPSLVFSQSSPSSSW
jgi:hypothetical protein